MGLLRWRLAVLNRRTDASERIELTESICVGMEVSMLLRKFSFINMLLYTRKSSGNCFSLLKPRSSVARNGDSWRM